MVNMICTWDVEHSCLQNEEIVWRKHRTKSCETCAHQHSSKATSSLVSCPRNATLNQASYVYDIKFALSPRLVPLRSYQSSHRGSAELPCFVDYVWAMEDELGEDKVYTASMLMSKNRLHFLPNDTGMLYPKLRTPESFRNRSHLTTIRSLLLNHHRRGLITHCGKVQKAPSIIAPRHLLFQQKTFF